jgi:Zn-dependent oligopeptidase
VTTPSWLRPLHLPAAGEDWAEWLAQRSSSRLDDVRRDVSSLTAGASGVLEPLETLRIWNEISIALSDALGAATVLIQVHPDEAIRSQAESSVQEAKKLATELSLDRSLYEVLAALDPEALDDQSRRVLRLTLRDFARAGVDADEATRHRVRKLSEQETVLGQRFSKNIRDDVRTVALSSEQLRGLPGDYVDAHPPGADGRHRITTDYPDVIPFLSFAEDREARRTLHIAFLSRGWPDNESVLRELLALRAEHAAILGYDDWASYDAEVKMIGDGPAIGRFIDDIAAAAEPSGRRDRDVLLEWRRRDDPQATAIDRADTAYYAEKVRRDSFAVDSQEVRRYFPFDKVRQGLLDVTGRLFGLEYTAALDPTWHPDVKGYDVALDGERLGRIYLDLHPRPGKYKHAAQFDLVSGVAARQLAEGVLVCNFPQGLMEHREVVTLFHEFGHLVHHVLAGRHEWVRFSGVATEWDFVEAPSQLLEEWAWDAEVLRSFATDELGDPIPVELVGKMRAANDFGKGYQARTQMFYAALSYRLHLGPVDDIDGLVRQLQATYDLFAYVEGTHFQASFGHLESYTSAYYTYMWSLVIAKDLFSAFGSSNLFDTSTATRYRDTILSAGGSRDAADLVAAFLGRPYDSGAFTRWLGEALWVSGDVPGSPKT